MRKLQKWQCFGTRERHNTLTIAEIQDPYGQSGGTSTMKLYAVLPKSLFAKEIDPGTRKTQDKWCCLLASGTGWEIQSINNCFKTDHSRIFSWGVHTQPLSSKLKKHHTHNLTVIPSLSKVLTYIKAPTVLHNNYHLSIDVRNLSIQMKLSIHNLSYYFACEYPSIVCIDFWLVYHKTVNGDLSSHHLFCN